MRNVTHASGEDVDKVIEAIENNTKVFPREQVIMACLAYAIWTMYPQATATDIFEGVGVLSNRLCDFLATRYPELEVAQNVPNNQLN